MRRFPFAVVVLLAAGVLVPAVAGGVVTASGPDTGPATPETGIVQVVTYSPDPDNESTVELRVEYRAGSDVTGLVLYTPSRSTVVSTTAFERREDGFLYAGDDFEAASATFRVELPRETVDDHWGQGVATREWAVVGGLPGTGYYSDDTEQWAYEDDDRVTRELRVEGDGTAGSRSVVLGNHTVYERDVNGTEVRLVTLPGSPPARPPEEVLDALAFTARTLEVGPRDESLLVVHVPVRSSAVTGTSFSDRRGGQDIWLYSPGWGIENTWLHEYVHTRQTHDLAEDMRWFQEASANYYEKLFALRAGAGDYDTFRDLVGNRTAGGVLAEPDRWQRGTQYVRGQRVLAALDARIGAATDYERSLADVFRLVNEHEGTVALADFIAYVSEVAGTDMDEWIRSHVAGTADVSFVDDPYAYTNPSGDEDPDGDGLADAEERDRGTHPFRADTDDDDLNDSTELDRDTDPTTADTDGDGLVDGRERDVDTDPLVADTDDDGLSDGAEVDEYGTDPTETDTDGDGFTDGGEVAVGTDPTEPTSGVDFWIARVGGLGPAVALVAGGSLVVLGVVVVVWRLRR
jgi:hypothetical protein